MRLKEVRIPAQDSYLVKERKSFTQPTKFFLKYQTISIKTALFSLR